MNDRESTNKIDITPSEEADHEEARDACDSGCGRGLGYLIMLVAVVLSLGYVEAIVERPADWGISQWGLNTLLLASVWSLAVAFFIGGSNRPWALRVSTVVGHAGGWGICAFVFCLLVRHLWINRAEPVHLISGVPTAAVLFVLSLCYGVAMCLQEGRARSSGESLGIMGAVLWPALAGLAGGLLGITTFVLLVGLTFLGERVGVGYGHPYVGATCGPVLLLIVIVVLMSFTGGEGRAPESRDKSR